MKILFLGYSDASLIDFMRKEGDAVTVVASDQKITPEFVAEGQFDFLVSYGYLHILKKEILETFSKKAINLHISYLPWNKGKDPNFWSFIEGTPKGVTIHYLDGGVDTGDIIVQKELKFEKTETLQSSYEKLRRAMEALFCEHWSGIKTGDCPRKPQSTGGSFHLQKERKELEHLLTEGWNTPVAQLIDYGRKQNLNKGTITINGRGVGAGKPCYIIAEIGTNYNGDTALALKMIQAAKEAGCDAVKFQIITADRSYVKQSESYPIFKKIELKKSEWKAIFDYAKELKIDAFATFVNPQDLADYSDFNWPVFKVSSSNLTNFPLLKVLAKQKKPLILSTGLNYLAEVREAIDFLQKEGVQEMALLQCTSLYPAPAKEVNLSAMRTLAKEFPKCPVGFSDHTEGIVCAVASVALGGSIIEKHFTLDKKMPGPDHFFSATPEEMKHLVQGVREVEAALGSSEKKPVAGEMPLREKWQRSLVALKNLPVGTVLTVENVGVKRSPKKGMEPKQLEAILGKKITKEILEDDPITKEVL